MGARAKTDVVIETGAKAGASVKPVIALEFVDLHSLPPIGGLRHITVHARPLPRSKLDPGVAR